jgi:hypothetical protein
MEVVVLRKKVLISGLTLVVVTSLLSGPAQANQKIGARDTSQGAVAAASKKVANRPSVVAITASKARSKRVNITVTLQLGSTIRGAAPTGSEVRIGRNICRISKAKRKCTVRNVSINSRLRISARTRNKSGFSKWSKAVSFRATSGKRWSRRSGTPGTTTPTVPPQARIDLARTSVIGSTSIKLAKIEGIGSGSVSSANASSRLTRQISSASAGNVTFQTAGTVAFAQADSASQTGSKLLAVSATGQLADAVIGGAAVVRDFFTAPDGNIYVIFETKVELSPGATPCLLARVDPVSGATLCVDSTLDSITWRLGNSSGNSPVQFDGTGAIYYTGESSSKGVLRRFLNGAITDLINDNIRIQDFAVLDNGTTIVAGTTSSTQSQWLRRIAPNGGLKNLSLGSVHSIWKYADGSVYVGLWGTSEYGIKRFLPELDALESKFWLSGNLNGIGREMYFSADLNQNLCKSSSSGVIEDQAFCGWYGTVSSAPFNISGQSTFAVAGSMGQSRQLWQYFPIVEKANITQIRSVTVASQAQSKILVAGTDAQGVNLVSVYEPAMKQETVVLDGSNEIEVYSMSFSERTNSILFSGLRFIDNQFVVGQISLS